MNLNNLPDTAHRVQFHTDCKTNQKIRDKTIESLNNYKDCDDATLTQRIIDLDGEWDTERVLETNAGIILVASTVLGFVHCRYWFALTGTVGCFLLHHALQGWCPPLPVIRKLGVRTSEEIYNEKNVLKQMRGDFSQISSSVPVMLQIAEQH
ncbi:MAG TPA: YgaP-like transmembrane domain [Caproiciproducens sp.]|nr:YgaP-like transmembrane domain [Caproiciproducens sp.]